MKLDKMFQSLLLTSAAIVFIITPAQGEEVPEDVQGKSSVTPTKPTSHDTGKVTDKGLAITQSSRFAPKSRKTQLSSSVTSLNSVQPTKKILQLSEIEHFSKSAELLVQSPTPTPTNPPNPEQRTGEQVVPITGVKANATNKGVEVILQTTLGQQLQVSNRSAGNNFIADISGTQLRLPSGEAFTFRSEKPLTGITEITVTNVDAKTVRVTVVGEKALPTVELFDDNAGLVFGITSAATAMQPPQQPETPQKPEPEKPASETPQEKPLNSQQDEPIELVVTGEQDGYIAPDALTATKTDTPLRDIPQSIQVIPQKLIRDQQATRIGDVLQNVSGVQQPASTSRSHFDTFFIRGFSSGSEGILRNGLRDRANTRRPSETANLERIEVLKGPAAALYGQGGLGGTINLVTEKPLSEPYYSVEAMIGSPDFYRGVFDISGPVNTENTLLYRLNAAAETRGSFFDFAESQRFFVSPVLTWLISKNTNLTLEAEYIAALRVNEWGLPAEGTVLPNPNGKIPRNRYTGEPDEQDNRYTFRLAYDLQHRFSDNWQVRNAFQVTFQKSGIDNELFFPGNLQPDKRTLQRSYSAFVDNPSTENYALDTYVVGKFKTGSIQHQLVAGFDLFRESNPTDVVSRPSSIDVFNPVYGRPLGSITRTKNETTRDALGFYIQDQITLADNLKLLLGGRFDILSEKLDDFLNPRNNRSQQNEAFSPRVGIVYQPIPALSLYANYSRAVNQVAGTTFDNRIFEPERGTQYEIGIKADFNDKVSATLAFYDLTKSNVLTTDPNNSRFSIQTGEQRSRGIELDIGGELLPGWNFVAAYAYTDAEIIKDNRFRPGNRLNNIPEHSLSLWTTYEIQESNLKGLGFGLGLYYVGDRQGDLGNTFELPNYFRTDAAIFYNRDNWRFALNFRNLFDVEYFENASSRTRVYYGEPFTLQATISWQF